MKFNPSDLTHTATYRIQFSKQFTFKHLEAILPYLHQLGISAIYASPVFKSMPGSTHGYDVTDPHGINPEIGTLEEWRNISIQLRKYGIWWLQDIVPNHMAFHEDNFRLWDVLEYGASSEFSHYFDINFQHPNPELKGKLMVPFLGEEADQAIEEGKLTVQLNEKGWHFQYNDHFFPLSPESIELLAGFASAVPGMETLETVTRNLLAGMKDANCYADRKELKTAWLQSVKVNSTLAADAANFLQQVNNSILLRKKIMEAQHYRLTNWNSTSSMINYRRFFTVNNLICLKMEDEKVFNDYHLLLEQLYKDGLIQGFRIDHIDGLADPEKYLERLRETFGDNCYVVAEKILAPEERTPETWKLEGTSGYDFLHFINQLYLHNEGYNEIKTFYRKHIEKADPASIILQSKELILTMYMRGEWENLAHGAEENGLLSNGNDRDKSKLLLKYFLTRMPVYRLYPPHHHRPFEKQILENVLEEVRKELPDIAWLENAWQREEDASVAPERTAFLQRISQVASPLMAKGVEDTTFYRYTPLIALNEVGDDPDSEKITQAQFHQLMNERNQLHPITMNASSTHDTKRGEDARARLLMLSHCAEEWIRTFEQWQQLNEALIQTYDIAPAEAYYIYQSMIGGFITEENFPDRLVEAHIKWVREAKVKTCWNDPDTEYEQRIEQFTRDLCKPGTLFYQSITSFVANIDQYARICSLSQLTIKCMAPGIPDIYQGSESTNFSFVDPDNRRPVHFETLEKILQYEASPTPGKWEAEKVWLTGSLLRIRKHYQECFTKGTYIPLDNSAKEDLFCFARVWGKKWILVVVPGKKGIVSSSAQQLLLSNHIQLPEDAPALWKSELRPGSTFNREDIHFNFKDFPVAVFSGDTV